jgi:hypothetical protein
MSANEDDPFAPPPKPDAKKKKKEKKPKGEHIPLRYTMTAAEYTEYEAKRKEGRRQAQKRIEREQLQKIRDRERKKRELEALGKEEKEASERWAEKQKKMQEYLLEIKEGATSVDEGPGQALHPSTAGIKLRNPRAYMRFYPAAVQPVFNGYKAVPFKIKKVKKNERVSALVGGGKLEVHPVSASGLKLPKGKDDGKYWMAMRMGGSEHSGDYGTVNTSTKGVTFPTDKSCWYLWVLGAAAASKPPFMTVRVYRDKLKLADADIDWSESTWDVNEKNLSKQGILITAKLKNRHGKHAGEATIRIRWTKSMSHAEDTSLVDMDVMSGVKMRFPTPTLDPRGRWLDPDSFVVPDDDDDEYSDEEEEEAGEDISQEERRRRDFLAEPAPGQDGENSEEDVGDGTEDETEEGLVLEDLEDEGPAVGAHKSTFMNGNARTKELTMDEQLMYNSSMMIHPCFFGYDITPLTSQNPSFVSPVYFNTYLKLGDDAEDDLKQPFTKTGLKRKKWRPIPGIPADLAENGCPTCFSGDRPGCPCCWSFPDVDGVMRGVRLSSLGAAASDAAISETMSMPMEDLEKLMTDEELKVVKTKTMEDIHTKLRSSAEIASWRELKKQYIRVYIKCMLPSGPVVSFTVSTDDTVYYLYRQYASCCGTVAEHCGPHMRLMIPTENGIFVLDNTDLPEDDMQLGQITCDYKLSEFNIEGDRRRGVLAEVTLLMLPVVNNKSQYIIQRWLDLNVNMDPVPPCELQYYQVNPISVWSGEKIVLPAKLPGIDSVQNYLCDMQAHEIGMYKAAMDEDRADRLAILDNKKAGAYKEAKEAATAMAKAKRDKQKQDKKNRLHAMVQDVSGVDSTPFKAQLKGLKATKMAKRRKRPPKEEPPQPKGLKALKQRAKKILAATVKTVSTIGPVVVDAAYRAKESLKDVAEEQVLDMIDEIEDQRELDDIPQGMYQAGETKKKQQWPHEEYEVVTVYGRTTTLKCLLKVARALGRPFEFPEVEKSTRRMPKVWGVPPPRRTQANMVRERKLALAKMRNLEAIENALGGSSESEQSESEEEDSSSDDESGDLPGLFDPNKLDMLQAPPASLDKGAAYHLPVLLITPINM